MSKSKYYYMELFREHPDVMSGKVCTAIIPVYLGFDKPKTRKQVVKLVEGTMLYEKHYGKYVVEVILRIEKLDPIDENLYHQKKTLHDESWMGTLVSPPMSLDELKEWGDLKYL